MRRINICIFKELPAEQYSIKMNIFLKSAAAPAQDTTKAGFTGENQTRVGMENSGNKWCRQAAA
ncbi:MAG: hypothetical protein ABFS19_08265 [Thermodesulfobacteriota bacterium]